MEPIKPDQIAELKKKIIPDIVINTFNVMIAKNFRNKSSTVYQKHVVESLLENGLTRNEIFDNNYLDVEDIYRQAGWSVEYDKPAYNESYDASFTFRVK